MPRHKSGGAVTTSPAARRTGRTRRTSYGVRGVIALGLLLSAVAVVLSQADSADADLERVSAGRAVAIGVTGSDRNTTRIPIETYVARVLAGEAEPNAPDGELQALAIAIRTYATFNAGRHARDGFDLCNTTHCQVMRAATAATRHAALSTAGEILTWNGRPAEIFYSASCGGRSETASAIWPGASLPYLQSVRDDVHDDDPAWTFALPLADLQRLLAQRGFAGGRLRDVRVGSHTPSGRVATLRLSGLQPDVIAGDQFRLLVGARDIRSTSFTVERHDDRLEFRGRGYGHGVGMCVIGAGRRARRGEAVREILAHYYPGLEVRPIDATVTPVRTETRIAAAAPPAAVAAPAAVAPAAITIRGGDQPSDVQQAAARAHPAVAQALGVTGIVMTIDVHDTVEGFRQATGKPWWVSASVTGTVVDLAPLPLVTQREGLDATLRTAIARAMMAPALADRAEWVRVGGARYFARPSAPPVDPKARLKCPADAELTLAISAAAQREAEARAEACFARAYAATGDWRRVR